MSERAKPSTGPETTVVDTAEAPEAPKSRLGNAIVRLAEFINTKLEAGVDKREAAKQRIYEIGGSALNFLKASGSVLLGVGIMGVEAAGKGINRAKNDAGTFIEDKTLQTKAAYENGKNWVDDKLIAVGAAAENVADSVVDTYGSTKKFVGEKATEAKKFTTETVTAARETLEKRRVAAVARKNDRMRERADRDNNRFDARKEAEGEAEALREQQEADQEKRQAEHTERREARHAKAEAKRQKREQELDDFYAHGAEMDEADAAARKVKAEKRKEAIKTVAEKAKAQGTKFATDAVIFVQKAKATGEAATKAAREAAREKWDNYDKDEQQDAA